MAKPYPKQINPIKNKCTEKKHKCLSCKKPTEIVRGKIKLYCNSKCKDKYFSDKFKKIFRDKKCKICGKVFKPSRITQKYCSKRCKEIQYNKSLAQKKCKVCEKSFNPHTSLDKFCSSVCRVNYHKSKRARNWTKQQVEKRIGENNPAYRNGFYTSTAKRDYSPEFIKNSKEIKKEMIDDVGYLYCQYTGRSDSLKHETHHIIFRSEKPNHPHLHSKMNLIVVGIEAHNEFHKHKWIRNKIVKDRGLDAIFGKDVLFKSELK